MRESAHVSLTRVPHRGLWDTTQSRDISRTSCLMSMSAWMKTLGNFKDSALFIGNKLEHPGKHIQLTSAFSKGTPIPRWVYWPRNDTILRAKKQSVRIKPFKSQRPYGRWNRNRSALLPWVKTDEHSTEKKNLAKNRLQWNICFLRKSYQNWLWQWNQKAINLPFRKKTVQGQS